MPSLLEEIEALEGQQAGAVPGLDEQIRQAEEAAARGEHVVEPRRAAIETRESGMAAQVNQTSLGDPGLQDTGLRADLSFSARFDEKREKFLNSYPDGDMVQVIDPGALGRKGGVEVLFRRSPGEPYAKVDADAMEKFEFTGDIADIAGDTPAILLEALLTRGGALWKQAIGAFLGGAGGEVLKESIESWRGYQRESAGEIATRAAQQGAMASAGAISTVAVSGPLNAVRGVPAIAVVPGAARAQMAAERLGIPRLTAGQISQSPLWRRISGQSAAIVKNVGMYVQEQNAAASRAFRSLRDKDVSRVLAGDLSKLHDEAREQIVTAALKADPVDLSVGGKALQEGVAEYDDLARTMVNRLYAEARGMETPEFNTAPAVAIADEIEKGISGMVGGQATRLDPITGELSDIVATIRGLDVNAAGEGVAPATDQLRALRSRLWELKTPAPGEISRAEHVQAGRLFSAIGKVLDDPKNVSPEFREAWSKASTEAKMRFDTMDKLLVIKAAKSEDLTNLARGFVKPYQGENLKLIKGILPAGRWDEFKRSALSELLAPNRLDNLTKTLKTYDKATLNEMFTPVEQQMLEGVGKNIDRLNALGLPQLLGRQTRRGNIAYDLLVSNERAQVETFGKMVGANPAVKKEVRAGLIDALVSRHIDQVEGVPTIRWKQYNADLDKMIENGAMRFLTADDVKILRDLKRVGEFLPDTADPGTSLVGAEVASGVLRIHDAGAAVNFIADMARYAGVGRLMTTRGAQRILLGSDKKAVAPKAYDTLRAAGAIAAELVNDVEGGIPGAREEPQP